MVVMQAINCRGFLTCAASLTPNEGYRHPNIGNGVLTQFVYVFTGKFVGHPKNKPDIIVLPGEIADISAHANEEFYFTAGDAGVQYLAINPIPENKRFTSELINGAAQKFVTGDLGETIVFCLTGDVTVNGIALVSTQYVNVPNDKTADIRVSSNSTAAIFKAAVEI